MSNDIDEYFDDPDKLSDDENKIDETPKKHRKLGLSLKGAGFIHSLNNQEKRLKREQSKKRAAKKRNKIGYDPYSQAEKKQDPLLV